MGLKKLVTGFALASVLSVATAANAASYSAPVAPVTASASVKGDQLVGLSPALLALIVADLALLGFVIADASKSP